MELEINSLILREDFFIAYFCGVVILILFCLERFNEPTNTGGSFLEALVPRAISNGFQYTQTFVIYVAIMLAIYTGLSVIAPNILPVLGLDPKVAGIGDINALASSAEDALNEGSKLAVPAWVPLTMLVVLTGGATHIKALNQVELRARRLAHRLIGIPQDVESLAVNLRDRRIDLAGLSPHECQVLISFYDQIAPAPAAGIETVKTAIANDDALRRWLRLSFLTYQMETRDFPAGFRKVTEQDHRQVWEAVRRTVDELRGEEGQLKLLSASLVDLGALERETRGQILARIDGALRNLHALIAIALYPVRKDSSQVRQITDGLGLSAGDVEDNALLNRVVLATIALFFGVLLVVWLSQGDPITALRWAGGSCVLHGAAAYAAWRFYVSRNRRGEWKPLRFSRGELPALQYVGVAWRGFAFATVALAVWHGIDRYLSTGAFPLFGFDLVWIPAFGALGVATGFWTAYDFDLLQRSASTVRRTGQIVMQGVTTGICAYFITIAVQAALGVDLQAGQAMAVQVTLTAGVAGAILGFIAVFLTNSRELVSAGPHFAEPAVSHV